MSVLRAALSGVLSILVLVGGFLAMARLVTTHWSWAKRDLETLSIFAFYAFGIVFLTFFFAMMVVVI